LLGNDREKNETTAVAKQRPERHWTGWKSVFSAGFAPIAAQARINTKMRRGVFYAVHAEGL
jgi:hypothetical protein